MINTYDQAKHAKIQLFEKISVNEPGCAYIASFDSGITYKEAIGLESIEENLPITTKTIFNLASVSICNFIAGAGGEIEFR